MAGAMRKAMVYLGLVEGQDRYDDGYDDDVLLEDGGYDRDERDDRHPRDEREADLDDPRDRRPEPVGAVARGATVASLADRRPVAATTARRSIADAPRITTLHPRTYNDARTIGEHFREGTPVIMNLTDMDDVDAKRLVDFAAGLVFGLRGAIDKITTKVFLLSPSNVSVTAEDKARIAESSGFFNQS